MRKMFTIIGGISVSDLMALTAALPKGAIIKSAGTGYVNGVEKRMMEILVPEENNNEPQETTE